MIHCFFAFSFPRYSLYRKVSLKLMDKNSLSFVTEHSPVLMGSQTKDLFSCVHPIHKLSKETCFIYCKDSYKYLKNVIKELIILFKNKLRWLYMHRSINDYCFNKNLFHRIRIKAAEWDCGGFIYWTNIVHVRDIWRIFCQWIFSVHQLT